MLSSQKFSNLSDRKKNVAMGTRVLQIGLSKNLGGVERFVYNYAEALQKYDICFDYVDLYGDGLAGEAALRNAGSRIYTIKDSQKSPFKTAKLIRKIVREGNYRCVHVNMLSAANPVPAIAALQAKATVIVHSHSISTVGIHRKLLHSINTPFLRTLSFVRLACGDAAGRWMYGSKAFRVCPNAIDVEQFAFDSEKRRIIRSKMGIGEDTLVLGFVGVLTRAKNPAYLAKILQSVKGKTDKKVKLLVVGAGDLLQELQNTASELDVQDDVCCVGKQENVSDWYSAMDVLLLPSLFEGLPFVAVEAQASGLPCLVSDRVSDEVKLTDLVHTCSLTDSADNWAKEILQTAAEPLDRKSYGSEMAETDYSLRKSAKLLHEIYTR